MGAMMNIQTRIRSKTERMAGTSSVKTQDDFRRTNFRGFWPTENQNEAVHPAYLHRRHADGTIDLIRLEPSIHGYIELGGKGCQDFAAGRI